MKKVLSVILISLCVFSAFASAKKDTAKASKSSKKDLAAAPEWVTGTPSNYPAVYYITGVGSGETDSGAEDSAKSEVTKIIRMKIESNETYDVSSTEISSDSKFSSSINTTASLKEISGIKIVKKYSSNDGTIYALAVLDRQQAADYYASLLHANEKKINQNIKLAEQNRGKLKSVSYAETALNLAKENEYNLFLINVLAPLKKPDTTLSYTDTESIVHFSKEIIEDIQVAVSVTNDSANLISNAFSSIITDRFMTISSAAAADYIIEAEISLTDLGTNDDKHYFVNYSLSSSMKDKATGNNVITFSKNGRAGHLNTKGAEQKAYMLIKDIIEKEFKAKLNDAIK